MIVANREIANFHEPYVIAEIGANHNGSMELAERLVIQAAEAGCHCVKFQSWTKESVFSRKVYEDNYFLSDDYRNRTDYTLEQIVEEFSVSQQELKHLSELCRAHSVDFACTPFSRSEVDFLCDELDISFIKVASMDLNNYDFLRYMAAKQRPILLSTGLSTLSEIDKGIQVIESTGNRQLILLHCVSVYPPADRDINLNNIDMLRVIYPDYPVGYSDHSIGTPIPLAAVAKGACVIEKHFTLDKTMFGWDHKVSANSEEMKQIVDASRRIADALGSYRRVLNSAELRQIPAFRRSIVAARAIVKGQVIERGDLDTKRPGTGFEPQYLELVIGRVAKRDIPADTVLSGDDF
jgi:sialic acid synthase SpsE